MIFNLNNREMIDGDNSYEMFSQDGLICLFRGFVWTSGKEAGKESIKLIFKQYIETGKIDFTMFYGAYHIIFIDKQKDVIKFFGDNAGHCCFYYNDDLAVISDSFLELAKATGVIKPNYSAITEFIHFNCIYSDNTICEEISRTDAMNYYTFQELKLKDNDKELEIWNGKRKYSNLNDFISDIGHAAKNLKITDIITGGTDSRTVLSHLVSLNIDFDLAISGRQEMIDVKIAKEIADKLDMDINVSDEKANEMDEDDLRKIFKSSDGVFGVFSRYRLHNKDIMLKKLGSELELGGVGGELYKNGFLNQDLPFYNFGKVNKNKFYKLKINPSRWGSRYLTENIMRYEEQMERKVIENLFDGNGGKKSNAYYKVGHKIIRHRMVTISNSSNLSIPSISPFTEVDIMKLTYNENPWKLELNRWQRNEVSKYSPEIASIKTDRGLTLQNGKIQVLKEFVLSYLFLIKIGLNRLLFKKAQVDDNKRLDIYLQGRELKEFEKAMNKCKELNILNTNCDIETIPDTLADRLMTIGLVFMGF